VSFDEEFLTELFGRSTTPTLRLVLRVVAKIIWDRYWNAK